MPVRLPCVLTKGREADRVWLAFARWPRMHRIESRGPLTRETLSWYGVIETGKLGLAPKRFWTQ